ANDSSAGHLINLVMTDGDYARVPRQQLLEALERLGALNRARARADEYAEAACLAIGNLPTSEYSQALEAIPTYVLDRDR
ncbi:MAG: hypothetical protein ABR557_07355, partial [Pyrinomonadaceae bacterium]